MSATKIVPSAPTPAQTALDTRLSAQAADYADARFSPSTRRAYIGAVRNFASAVGQQGALPAAPETVANYLATLAGEGKAVATIRLAAAAIGASHVEAELPSPTNSKAVKSVLRGLARTLSTAQRQAKPLDEKALIAIDATACRPRSYNGRSETPAHAVKRGQVDIALCRLVSDAGLRVSEASELLWDDVSEWDDGSGSLHIARSKTDAEGEGADVALTESTMQALAAIRNASPGNARIFALGAQSIRNRIAAAARHAGLGSGFSGHSGRVGLAHRMTTKGAPLQRVQVQGRWKSAAMVARYTSAIGSRDALKWL
jgi:integrase